MSHQKRTELHALLADLERNAHEVKSAESEFERAPVFNKAYWANTLATLRELRMGYLVRIRELEEQLGLRFSEITVKGVTYRQYDHVSVTHLDQTWSGYITKIIIDEAASFRQIFILREDTPYDISDLVGDSAIEVCLSKPVKNCPCYGCNNPKV